MDHAEGGSGMRTLFEFNIGDFRRNGTVGRRPSVRGIILRGGEIAMVYSEKYRYVKFPGGGINEGESYEDTLVREVREETGMQVIPDTIREYGLVIREEKGMIDDLFVQENYYYTCSTEETLCEQNLDAYEAEEHFRLRWLQPEEAIAINRERLKDELDDKWLRHIIERDTMVLEKLIEEGMFARK